MANLQVLLALRVCDTSAPGCGPCPCWVPRRTGLWGQGDRQSLTSAPQVCSPSSGDREELGSISCLSLSHNDESLTSLLGDKLCRGRGWYELGAHTCHRWEGSRHCCALRPTEAH